MLVLRLKPIGKKKQIGFRLVVAEKRSKLDGRFIEDLGFYNPKTNRSSFKTERIKSRIKDGVQPSDTVYNLLVTAGILEGPKKPIKIKKINQRLENKTEQTVVKEAALAETPASV